MPTRRPARRSLLRVWLLLLVVVMAGTACRKSEEARIRALLDDAVAGAEAANPKKTLAQVADDFRADNGADRDAIKGVLAREMLQGNRITVIRRDQSITVEGETAKASFDAALLRGDRAKLKGLVPQRMGTWRFVLDLEKRDGEWWIVAASYQPIPTTEFVINDADF